MFQGLLPLNLALNISVLCRYRLHALRLFCLLVSLSLVRNPILRDFGLEVHVSARSTEG